MNSLESHGIDNFDFVQARMEEKAKEEAKKEAKKESVIKGKKQIVDNLKDYQKRYHALYLMMFDWLKNYAKTGESDFGGDNYKEDLEKIGEVDGYKIKLTKELANKILEDLKK